MVEIMKKTATSRPPWRQIFKGKVDEFDPLSGLAYWKDKPALDKFREVDNLIRQAQLIAGGRHRNGPQLLRSTAVLKRQ